MLLMLLVLEIWGCRRCSNVEQKVHSVDWSGPGQTAQTRYFQLVKILFAFAFSPLLEK